MVGWAWRLGHRWFYQWLDWNLELDNRQLEICSMHNRPTFTAEVKMHCLILRAGLACCGPVSPLAQALLSATITGFAAAVISQRRSDPPQW